MTFEIDEEKIKSALKNKKDNDDRVFGEGIVNFFGALWKFLLWIVGGALALAFIIFVGGGLLGIMMFGWRQL